MHEYRLDERECETANGLQDAYALCRIFKKCAPGPKIIEHYGAPCVEHFSWMLNDNSTMTDLSADGIGDELESSNYHFQPSNCSQTMIQCSSVGAGTSWMQFFADEALSSAMDPFQNPSGFSHMPSEVDVALECARFQQRFAVPPLEVEDYPQLHTDSKILYSENYSEYNIYGGDSLQEILAIASASQELINNPNFHEDIWATRITPHFNEPISSLIEPLNGLGSSTFIAKSCGLGEQSAFVDISELEDEFKEQKADNLREAQTLEEKMMGMNTGVQQKDGVPNSQTEQISDAQAETHQENLICESAKIDNKPIYSESQEDDFSIGFINIHQQTPENAGSPSFDVYHEEVQFNHGLLMSSQAVAKTLFHQIAPSKNISFHLNPIKFQEETRSKISSFGKFKDLVWKKLKGIKKGSVLPMPTLVEALLDSCIYHEGLLEKSNWLMRGISALVEAIEIGRRKLRCHDGDKKKQDMRNSWFPNIRGRSISRVFINGNFFPWRSMIQATAAIFI